LNAKGTQHSSAKLGVETTAISFLYNWLRRKH